MYLASLKQKYKTKEMVTTFQGYCHRDVISDGQWFDMTNMSARKYPAITTRPNRQILTKVNGEAVSNVAAMVDMDGLVWLGKDGSLHAGGNVLPNFYAYTEAERQMVPMGGYLIVFPDKVWANAVKLRMGGEMVEDVDYGKLEEHWQQEDDMYDLPIDKSNGIWAYNCKANGERWNYIPSGWAVVDGWPDTPGADEALADARTALDISVFPYAKYRLVSNEQPDPKMIWCYDGPYFGYLVQETAPENPEENAVYVNTSGAYPVLQKWFPSTRMWSAQETLTRLESAKPFGKLAAGDSVSLRLPKTHYYRILRERRGTQGADVTHEQDSVKMTLENMNIQYSGETDGLYYLAGKGITLAGGEYYGSVHAQLVGAVLNVAYYQESYHDDYDYIWQKTNAELANELFEASGGKVTAETLGIKPVKLSRSVPDMDYVIESNNRLWGCFYGERDGKMLNEIYASKLGDFKNWNSFQGLSTDSYAASRGSDGPWTGAITMNNYPLFFKRNCLEKVYISASGAHQIATTKMPGVQPGSWRSMQIVDGVLFYLSDTGVMVYDGSLPDHISNDFGNVKYSNGIAGKQGYNYYLSVKAQDGSCSLFNLDTTKGVWHREDATRLTQTADRGDVLYMLTEDGRLLTPGTLAELDEGELEGDFTWEIVSGAIGYQRAEQEYLLRLIPRIKLELGGSALVHVMFDDNGDWQRVACIENNSTHSVTIPVKTRRCDHFRIKISGIGGVTLFTIVREIEKGSLEG